MGKVNAIEKAFAISNAKISFVSLVNKAANKTRFLITKAEDGNAQFQTYGSILMSETKGDAHFLTGIVYAPMVKDAHDNYMTAEEIAKAEKYFTENSGKIDVQHSFKADDNLTVVKSWINPCDCTINGEEVKKGAWVMTVKVEDDSIWEKVQKGEITGFSMGGVGEYSNEDVDIDEIIDTEDVTADEGDEVSKSEKSTLLRSLAKALGFKSVKKGEVAEKYEKSAKSNNFWTAFNSLEGVLKRYNSFSGMYDYETDPDVIKEALEEFNTIITDILTSNSIKKSVIDTQPKQKAVEVKKSTANDNDGGSETPPEENKEEEIMKKSELIAIVNSTVADVMKAELGNDTVDVIEKDNDSIDGMSKSEIADIVKSAATEAIKKYSQARANSTNIDSEIETVEKQEEPEYYLHGVL